MVSDTSTDELIAFARKLGIPDKGFQGDHYDVPDHMRSLAIENGATEVSTRTILAALYAAGIRQRPEVRHGRPQGTHPHQP
jgi:hypothetical protein